MLLLYVNSVNKSTRPPHLFTPGCLTDRKGIRSGVGLHIQDITYAPVEKVIYSLKLHLFAGEFIYAAALFLGQISILCLYWRIFSVPEARLAVKIILPSTLAWLIVRVSSLDPVYLFFAQLTSHLSCSSS
jgi:hypothetical protein